MPLKNDLATAKADLANVKDELTAVEVLSAASKEDAVTRYIVKPFPQDELDEVADIIHGQLPTDLCARIARDIGPEARQCALQARHGSETSSTIRTE